jgi:hypothetical protein
MVTLDRLVLLSTALFAAAALLVLISISRPRWILSVNQGMTINNYFHYMLFITERHSNHILLVL